MSRAPLNLGASTWGFFRHLEQASWPRLSDVVEQIVGFGLGVEIWETRAEGDGLPDEEENVRIVAACKFAEFVSVHATRIYHAWHPQEARNDLDFATRVGAQTLVVHPRFLGLPHPDATPDLPDIRRWLDEAAQRGVRVVLENVEDSIWALDWFLDAIGDDPERTNLGICIDVGHAHMSRDAGRHPVANYIERYRGSLCHLHLHDTHGRTDEHLVPGRGTIDYDELFDLLERVGFSGTGVLELQAPEGVLVGLRAALEYLARFTA